MEYRYTALGEAAWDVPLACSHVVIGAMHEEGCSPAADLFQTRYRAQAYISLPIQSNKCKHDTKPKTQNTKPKIQNPKVHSCHTCPNCRSKTQGCLISTLTFCQNPQLSPIPFLGVHLQVVDHCVCSNKQPSVQAAPTSAGAELPVTQPCLQAM